MKLFYSTASPYARTAQVVLREVGLDPESIEIHSHPFDNQKTFLQANPLGKVPCLVLDSGDALFDSEVICQYLDDIYNQQQFWKPIVQNWSLRRVYSQVSGLLDLAVALRQEKMREDDGLRSDFWWQRFESGLLRGLNDLEQRIDSFPSLLTLLHVNLICLIDYLKFRHPEIVLNYPKMMGIYEGLRHRPSFKQTAPKN